MTQQGDPSRTDHLEAWVRWLEDGTWRVSVRTRGPDGRLGRHPRVDHEDSLVRALQRVERQSIDYAMLSGETLVFQTADGPDPWGYRPEAPLPF